VGPAGIAAATPALGGGRSGIGASGGDSQFWPEAASAVFLCASVGREADLAAGSSSPLLAQGPLHRRGQGSSGLALLVFGGVPMSQSISSSSPGGWRAGPRPAVRLPHAWPDRRQSGRASPGPSGDCDGARRCVTADCCSGRGPAQRSQITTGNSGLAAECMRHDGHEPTGTAGAVGVWWFCSGLGWNRCRYVAAASRRGKPGGAQALTGACVLGPARRPGCRYGEGAAAEHDSGH